MFSCEIQDGVESERLPLAQALGAFQNLHIAYSMALSGVRSSWLILASLVRETSLVKGIRLIRRVSRPRIDLAADQIVKLVAVQHLGDALHCPPFFYQVGNQLLRLSSQHHTFVDDVVDGLGRPRFRRQLWNPIETRTDAFIVCLFKMAIRKATR